jgi:hypothetical protein
MSNTVAFHRHARRSIDRAVSLAFSALAGDHAAHAMFTRILYTTKARSDLLRHDPRPVKALLNLARFHEYHHCPPEAWAGATGNPHVSVHALAQHLTARYPFPRAFASVWFGDDSERRDEERFWVIAHAGGLPFRDIPGLPMQMTRKMERFLLQSPHDLPLRAAMRRAELLALDAEPELVATILQTDLATDLQNGEFWRAALQFFVRHWEVLGPVQTKALIDYLYAIRIRRQEVRTPAGITWAPPPEPTFSLAGRTPESLLRLMAEWHARLAVARSTGRTWARAVFGGLLFQEPGREAEAVLWEVAELLSSNELVAEGRRLRHCVATYEWRCVRGTSSIWTLRRSSDHGPFEPRFTIEVDPRSRRIVQVRGHANSRAAGLPRQIVALWAEQERLDLPVHA